MSMATRFEIPTTLPSVANLREHWGARHTRNSKLRRDAQLVATALLPRQLREALQLAGGQVTLCRIARRRLDPDNNAAAMKPIQDGLADALGA